MAPIFQKLKYILIILVPELALSQGRGGIGYDRMGGDNNWWLLPSMWLLFLFLVGVFALKNFLSKKIELYKLNRKIKYEEKIRQKTKHSEWLKSNEGKNYKKRKIKFWTRFYVFIGMLIGVFIYFSYFSFDEKNDRWVSDSKTISQDLDLAKSDEFKLGAEAIKKGNFETAMRMFKPLALKGDNLSQTNVGMMYEFGYGVDRDLNEATIWYKAAVDQGNYAAMQRLSGIYVDFGADLRKGNEDCSDIDLCKEALQHYYAAAALANPDAMLFISNILLMLGGDLEKSVMWWSIADIIGIDNPEMKKNTETILNETKKEHPEIMASAEKLVRECVRKDLKGC